MTATGVGAPLDYNPYAYQMHEDPYPTYARLRAEAANAARRLCGEAKPPEAAPGV